VVCPNSASFAYFPVETSVGASGIVPGGYQETADAFQMFPVTVWLLSWLLGLHNRRKIEFSGPMIQICLTEVVGCVRSSRLRQFVKHHPPLPNAFHAVLYRFGDCAHHPAWFIIFAPRAELEFFFIMILVFPNLLIFGT